jgi:reverse gyrase
LHLFLLGLTIREIIDDKNLIDRRLNFLKKISFLKEDMVLANEDLKSKIEPIKKEFEEILKDNSVVKNLKEHPKIVLEINNDNNDIYGYLVVSDPRGYLQASGRSSRLFPLGLTKGLAVVLVDNIKTLKHLQDKLKILGYESNFQKHTEIDLNKILKKIDKDRQIVKEVLEGKEYIFQDPIETALVIVESPTKAKTIANFFGRPARRYKDGIIFYEISLGNIHLNICATLGHFVDLTHQKGFYGVKKENNEFIPIFQPLKICQNCQRHLEFDEAECSLCNSKNILLKENLIKHLQKIALEVDKIYLAPDPDTEGEKIAFDLLAYLYPYNQNIQRIELHEITRSEFIRKLKEPRDIDFNLVKAQLLRRISDRWIGFKLSGEIQQHFKNLNLSAGRVQTPVLGWILEKEKRIKQKHYSVNMGFNNQNFYFLNENEKLIKELKEKFKNQDLDIEIIFEKTNKEIVKPLPPYETSNLLKDANNFFRFDAPTTMRIAQNLFEQGLITYHRTDSFFISDFGKNVALEYLERKNLTQLKYLRSWGQPGTHEGIRPTKPLDVQDLIENMILEQKNLTKKHLQLYGLIFNRFMASQTKPSTALKAEIKIKIPNLKNKFDYQDSVFIKINKENHLKFFRNIRIANFKQGIFKVDNLKIKKVPKEYHFSQGELIDEMKKRGLGRPSTYSTIIQTLIDRKYVLNRSGYLIPISWGQKIYDYLIKKHKNLISEDFTIKLENDMDLVAQGKVNYQKILKATFEKIIK